jgi:hypothetical protein
MSGPPYPDEPIDVEPQPKGAQFVWRGLPGYQVRGVLRAGTAALELVELNIRATSDSDVKTQTLRSVPLGHLLPVARARLAWMIRESEARQLFGMPPRSPDELATAQAAAAVPVAPGRPALGDEHYRHVALALLEELTQGSARGVHERLARRLTADLGRHVTRDTARDWVRTARARAWLAPTKQGRPGAEPGPKLLDEAPIKPAKPARTRKGQR